MQVLTGMAVEGVLLSGMGICASALALYAIHCKTGSSAYFLEMFR